MKEVIAASFFVPGNKKEDQKFFLQLESDVDPVLCRYYY
jgi:hypothetical protein